MSKNNIKAVKKQPTHIELKVLVVNSNLLREAIVNYVRQMDFYFENSYEEAIELLSIAKDVEAATSLNNY